MHAQAYSPFVVRSILPRREVHLVFGPIAEENTLLALQIANDWRQGHEVFGFESYPRPFCYVVSEQSTNSLLQAMRTSDIDPASIPHLEVLQDPPDGDRSIDATISLAQRAIPDVEVLFVDGLYSLCPGRINDYHEASRFLLHMRNLCQRNHLTIIGCVSTAKSRDGEGYASPRERLHGSGAWGTIAHCKILIEPDKPSKIADPNRTVSLIPRYERPRTFKYTRGETGMLLFSGEAGGATIQPEMDSWLDGIVLGLEFSSRELRAAGEQFGLSPATVYRWLEDQIELGTMVRVRHGVYAKHERRIN